MMAMATTTTLSDKVDWLHATLYECLLCDLDVPLSVANAYITAHSPNKDSSKTLDASILPAQISLRLYIRNLKLGGTDSWSEIWPVFRVIPLIVVPAQFQDYQLNTLLPDAELWLEVLTQVVLQTVRTGQEGVDWAQLLTESVARHLTPEEQQTCKSPEAFTARRDELLTLAQSNPPDGLAELLSKYPEELTKTKVQSFADAAWHELGLPFLKRFQADCSNGQYVPTFPTFVSKAYPDAFKGTLDRGPAGSAPVSHKRPFEAAFDDAVQPGLRNRHNPPLSAKLPPSVYNQHPGFAAVAPHSEPPPQRGAASRKAAAAFNSHMVQWDNPVPQQIIGSGPAVLAPVLSPPLQMQPMHMSQLLPGLSFEASPGGGIQRTPSGRRKVGRWSNAEEQLLISLTQQLGKGKWKQILEEGRGGFHNRTQVDLKDKWRNLIKAGIVHPESGAPLTPPPLTITAPPDEVELPGLDLPEAAVATDAAAPPPPPPEAVLGEDAGDQQDVAAVVAMAEASAVGLGDVDAAAIAT